MAVIWPFSLRCVTTTCSAHHTGFIELGLLCNTVRSLRDDDTLAASVLTGRRKASGMKGGGGVLLKTDDTHPPACAARPCYEGQCDI